MPVAVHNHPLSWYAEKLRSGEPFAYLSYGDGEWLVVTGMRSGATMQAGEVVTPALEDALRAALDDPDPRLVRGTDPNLIRWRDYKGGDAAGYRELGVKLDALLAGYPEMEFTDGVVFERACWEGTLGPLLGALGDREVYLIGNEELHRGLERAGAVHPWWSCWVPVEGAADYCLNTLRNNLPVCDLVGVTGRRPCFVFCCGLAGSVLAREALLLNPGCAALDLGSSLDIFARIGEQRGWRAELYQDEAKYRDLVRRNLEGSE